MVLMVEQGGFFSSSASRYRILLRLRNKELPMKVSPWNHYQFAGQEAEHNIQLASKRMRVPRRCVSLIRFLRSCTRIKRWSSRKLVKRHRPETTSDSSSVKGAEDSVPCYVADEDESKLALKSCLKKQSKDCCSTAVQAANANDHCTEIRKVHWSDSCGKELAEVMMFKDRDNYSLS